MAKSKGNFFGNKGAKMTQNKNVEKKNIVFGDSSDSAEKMSEPGNIETAEMGGENLSGDESQYDAPEDTDQKDIISDNQSNNLNDKDLLLKIDELQDKYVRLMAEFDNFRRRTIKEKTDIIKSAGEDVLINLLPVIDDFDRGLKVMEQAPDIESVKLGIQLIYNKFKEFLVQRGVKEIDSLNQDFNVEMHEALTKIPAPMDELKGKVLDVIQKGYYLNDKVIRYAKVIVGE
jgi:molecular chaperone GrpE